MECCTWVVCFAKEKQGNINEVDLSRCVFNMELMDKIHVLKAGL